MYQAGIYDNYYYLRIEVFHGNDSKFYYSVWIFYLVESYNHAIIGGLFMKLDLGNNAYDILNDWHPNAAKE